jgi:DNA-binding NarL/FixJ family response regulator
VGGNRGALAGSGTAEMVAEGEDRAVLTRLVVLENHADFRNVMRVLLGQKPDLEVVAKVKALADDHQRCTELHFEVAVLDLAPPTTTGPT